MTKKFVFVVLNIYFMQSASFNISDSNYLSDMVVYRNRAFICMPDESTSLIEAVWNGQNTLLTKPKLRTFPTNQKKLANKVNRCVSLDVDSRGRLWVLDVPKDTTLVATIVILNTVLFSEIQRCDFTGIRSTYLNSIVIDPVVSVQWGPRAYIGDPGDGQLIVYCLKERRWWRLQLQSSFMVETVFVAISRRDSILYTTGSDSHQMFSISLSDIRKMAGPPAIIGNEVCVNATAKYLGSKLGPSSGLIVDSKGSLYYFLTRDFAIVKWDTKKPLLTENHQIVSQSSTQMPFVSDLFLGPQNNVWALINIKNDAKENNEIHPSLQNRCLKVNSPF